MDLDLSTSKAFFAKMRPIITNYPALKSDKSLHDLMDSVESENTPGFLFLLARNSSLKSTTFKELSFLREFTSFFLQLVFNIIDEFVACPQLSATDLKRFIEMQDFYLGERTFESELLSFLWQSMVTEVERLIVEKIGSNAPRELLENEFPEWACAGRIHLHLAEDPQNRREEPFVFLATVATRVLQKPRMQHTPLGKAVSETLHDPRLLHAILAVLQKSAAISLFMAKMLKSNKIFSVTHLSSREAFQFLSEFDPLESMGYIIKLPKTWEIKKPTKTKVSVHIGEGKPSLSRPNSGMNLFHFFPKITLEGTELSEEDSQKVLSAHGDLVKIRGKWVLAQGDEVAKVLSKWHHLNSMRQQGYTFAEALRIISRSLAVQEKNAGTNKESEITSPPNEELCFGDTFKEILQNLGAEKITYTSEVENYLNQHLKATLRPYQKHGVSWLWLLQNLGLGGCLADDMGLGKTLQVIAMLIAEKSASFAKTERTAAANISILVVPASLLGNWEGELEKFAPSLNFITVHPSRRKDINANNAHQSLSCVDLVITTYAMVQRLEWLHAISWRSVILDEAQAIKNPQAQQTIAIKKLEGSSRFALTGTPVENQASDLWSIIDFCVPHLLGSLKGFQHYFANATEKKDFSELRNVLKPILLRRLKTDRNIITDLPEKIEMKVYSGLTMTQANIYQSDLKDLKSQLDNCTKDIVRKGLILKYLLRFKQICNHPSQRLNDNVYDYKDSGKFLQLKSLVSQINMKREKFILFTQFRELTDILSNYLSHITGYKGLILHGSVPVSERQQLVKLFQEDEQYGFFVLSLRAGGSGLNLTRATQVIHFDRWWNPAVENQATDRCFRIGQAHKVLVHKFICRGTIEERIDRLIESKKSLADELISPNGEPKLMQMTNEALLSMLKLDADCILGDDSEI